MNLLSYIMKCPGLGLIVLLGVLILIGAMLVTALDPTAVLPWEQAAW